MPSSWIEADREFRGATSNAAAIAGWKQRELRKGWLFCIFLAFCREAREEIRQGRRSLTQIVHWRDELFDALCEGIEVFSREARDDLCRSAEWRQAESLLESATKAGPMENSDGVSRELPETTEAAEIEARHSATIQREPQTPSLSKWDLLQVLFVSDQRLQFFIDDQPWSTYNYADLGFADGRSRKGNKPKAAWETLKLLAQCGGRISNASSTRMDWPKIEKRIEEIREMFRTKFAIQGDPIPYVRGTGYVARSRSVWLRLMGPKPLSPTTCFSEKYGPGEFSPNVEVFILPIFSAI
jgi:hypothetical protein